MFKSAFTLAVLVALGPQVVQGSFKFKFSPIVQCSPVTISFSGTDSSNHSVPTTLTILPLVNNAIPIQIPIPPGSSNSTGIALSFIPLPADTTFIATLDNPDGPASKVSDVTRVLPPNITTGSNTCLSSLTVSTLNLFEIPSSIGQCESFSVAFATRPPSITAFQPNGRATLLPSSAANGLARYTMTSNRGNEVALLFNDPATNKLVTTALMTVSGDSGSSKDCLASNRNNNGNDSNNDGKSQNSSADGAVTQTGLPKGAVIGIAIGAALLVFAIMLLLWYFLRVRRRRRRASSLLFDPALLNRRWPSSDAEKRMPTTQTWYSNADEKSDADLIEQRGSISSSFGGGGVIRDPIYTNDKWRRSAMTDDGNVSVRTSISSWNQFVPEDQRSPGVMEPESEAAMRRNSAGSDSRLSMNTVDIQNILQIATVHRNSSTAPSAYTKRTPQPSTAGTTTTFDVAKPAAARLIPTRGTGRVSTRPDLPQGISPISRNNSAAVAIKGVPESYLNLGPGDDNYGSGIAIGTPRASDGLDGQGIARSQGGASLGDVIVR
ncbi:hypothetical protein MIND_00831100 [Mycena indigotica]|uniref:Mid2 domain-containing protein n=1 Tax=Mycena indigotica TaxID=2126181 RepID=A0A8H6SG86_9AGAR|nr:uncharacterized protein MIND_00831100 [Mycena indigotica]KAF7298834.1 hypothetical protein MIND_00831100 [Mycena indigotica]